MFFFKSTVSEFGLTRDLYVDIYKLIYTCLWSNTVQDFWNKQQILLNESKNLKSKIYKNTILSIRSHRTE